VFSSGLLSPSSGFKTFRAPEGEPEAAKTWLRMRKGIADLSRRADVSQAANTRYLKALASADDPTPLGRLTTRLAQPVPINGRRARALNPHAPADARVLETLSRGEFTISAFPSRHVNVAKRRVNGFRNRDLRALLFADAQAAPPDQQRHAASVSRQLALLRAHGLVRKVHGTHRYHLTTRGRVIVAVLISLRNVGTDTLTKLVA
jgi:hypothetical protein